MWRRFSRNIPGDPQRDELHDGIPINQLASFVYLAATEEALELVRALELGSTEANDSLPKVLAEFLAFYQYLVLTYAANIVGLDDTSLGLFGGSLNDGLAKIASESSNGSGTNKLLGRVVQGHLVTDEFHRLVGAYLAGDTSTSGLTPDEWGRLLKFTSYEELSRDFTAMNHLVLLSRLLSAFGTSFGEASSGKLLILVWMNHRQFAVGREGVLKKKFAEAFPGRIV